MWAVICSTSGYLNAWLDFDADGSWAGTGEQIAADRAMPAGFSALVFGIPVVGYRLPDGSYLENSQLEPDIKVANSPETIVKGEDTQLKAAVEELLKELEK